MKELFLVVVLGLGIGLLWWRDHDSQKEEIEQLQVTNKRLVEELDATKKRAQVAKPLTWFERHQNDRSGPLNQPAQAVQSGQSGQSSQSGLGNAGPFNSPPRR